MDERKSLFWILAFSIAGFLFAGYLTVYRWILGVCPLKDPCPIILGHAACVYGLMLFTILLIGTIFLLIGGSFIQKYERIIKRKIFWISLVGILFALYSTYIEIFVITCPGGCEYSLLVPTCIYGLMFYSVIFGFSIKILKK